MKLLGDASKIHATFAKDKITALMKSKERVEICHDRKK
ncbi:hypothetical protein PEC301645_33030 [Pectobacterium carotovorum subsp. carotovorum]|nr:hypothetical protein PEC301645_33030 [Pectobacterium carotovorum subsp. carotovorum]